MTSIQVQYLIGIIISFILLFAILIGLIFFYFKKKRKKESIIEKFGREAEEKVNKKIQIWSQNNNSYYIPSSMFKYNKNKIFEVDGILITPRALIIIEVKNINGIIEGKGLEKTWFKILGTKRHEIRNPIMQNDKHIEHILAITKLKVPILSLIIFDTRTEELKCTEIPAHVLVIKFEELETSLNMITDKLMPKINMAEIQQIYYSLLEHKTTDPKDYELLISFGKGNEKVENSDFTI